MYSVRQKRFLGAYMAQGAPRKEKNGPNNNSMNNIMNENSHLSTYFDSAKDFTICPVELIEKQEHVKKIKKKRIIKNSFTNLPFVNKRNENEFFSSRICDMGEQ